MLNIAIPTGRLGESAFGLLKKAGYFTGGEYGADRKLVFTDKTGGVSYFLIKPADVCTYVEHGVADLGIAGSDLIAEDEPDVYELLDLGIGKCFMAVASPEGYFENKNSPLRVATKYVRVAKAFFAEKGREIEIIKLSGSVEAAAVLGLADVIVDIVESGRTLKDNGLAVTEKVFEVSSRLIANKSAFIFKEKEIKSALARLGG
ncbi:MAG: ATP phosphoribosyltransferase [Eubacteriales bacterium]